MWTKERQEMAKKYFLSQPIKVHGVFNSNLHKIEKCTTSIYQGQFTNKITMI